MTAQPVRIEFEIDLGVERTRKIALDNNAAEPFSAPSLDLRAQSFAPIEFDRAAVNIFQRGST